MKMPLPKHVRRDQCGLSMVELLIVLAIIGIIAGVAALNGRRVVQGQEDAASLRSVRQAIWQGATAASSRGERIVLRRTGSRLSLVSQGGQRVRTFDLSPRVTTSLPEGAILTFTPPGRIDLASYHALPQPITVTTTQGTYQLIVSLIGEVKEIAQ